jgi:hypothetical protein
MVKFLSITILLFLVIKSVSFCQPDSLHKSKVIVEPGELAKIKGALILAKPSETDLVTVYQC